MYISRSNLSSVDFLFYFKFYSQKYISLKSIIETLKSVNSLLSDLVKYRFKIVPKLTKKKNM